jgi:hypothetical protein
MAGRGQRGERPPWGGLRARVRHHGEPAKGAGGCGDGRAGREAQLDDAVAGVGNARYAQQVREGRGAMQPPDLDPRRIRAGREIAQRHRRRLQKVRVAAAAAAASVSGGGAVRPGRADASDEDLGPAGLDYGRLVLWKEGEVLEGAAGGRCGRGVRCVPGKVNNQADAALVCDAVPCAFIAGGEILKAAAGGGLQQPARGGDCMD